MAEINLKDLATLKAETLRLRRHMNERVTAEATEVPASVAEVTELAILLDQVLTMLAPTSDNARLAKIEADIAELNQHQHQMLVADGHGGSRARITTRPIGFGSKR